MSTRLPARYLAGSSLARLAEEGMAVGIALLALERTGSPAPAAAVLACWLAPHIVAAPVIGTIASRQHRPVRFYAATLVAFAAAIATVVAMLGRAPFPLVLAVAVLGGTCGPVVSGGLSSLVASLVAPEARQRAYALDSAAYNAASVCGVGLAAGLTAVVSATAAGLVLAVSALGAAALIGVLPGTDRPDAGTPGTGTPGPGTRTRFAADAGVGLAALWREPTLRAVTAATCVAYLGIGALTVTAVQVAGLWNRPTDGGLLMTGFTAGALAGALALARWPLRIAPERLAARCLLLTGLALAAAACFPWFAPCLALFVLAGAGDGPLLSATLRVRAERAPAGVRAQVFTTGAALKLSAASLGAALIGLAVSLPAAVPLGLIALTQLAGFALLAGHRSRVPRIPALSAT